MRWLAVLAGILLLGFIFSQLSPAFLQLRNLQNITVQAAVTGVMAVGMTFVIMTAGIDISVGAIFYLSISLAASFTLNFTDPAAPYLAYPIAIVAGIVMGTINGLLTIVLRINPLITTLATLSIFRGLAIRVTEARILTPPEQVRFFGIGELSGIPMPIILAILAAVVGAYVLSYTRFGRYVLAIGASQSSARESALPVRRTLILVYVIAGLCAGIAGLISLGRVGAVQSDMGIGIEFTVITAVVLGGTALSGGRGSIVGSLLGAILLVMIDNGLNLISASPFIYDVVRGAVLIGAVLIDRGASLQALLRNLPFRPSASGKVPA
jgi:ribose transport system permease protein